MIVGDVETLDFTELGQIRCAVILGDVVGICTNRRIFLQKMVNNY
jgi:hypothetical protein